VEKGVQQGALELVLLDLRVDGPDAPLRLAAPSARASADYALSDRALDLSDLRVALRPLQLDGRIRAARPFGANSHLAVTLQGGPVGAAPLRSFLLDLGLAGTPREFAEALTDGKLATWSLRWTRASLARARALAADPLGAWPDDLEVGARVEGVGARIAGSSEPLRNLSGSIRLRRDQLELRDVEARVGDDPLPKLDLSVAGVAAVLHALQSSTPPPPVPTLPGWLALDEWVQAQRTPGTPSRWKRARIDLDWLDHPVLLRPVEDLHATLFPGNPGIRVEEVTARWGDTHVAGHVRMSGPPPHKLDVQVEATPDGASRGRSARGADPAAWTRGRFDVDLEKLGPLRADRVAGRLRVVGTRAAIRDADASVLPRGRLTGDVDLDLDHRDQVPIDARLRLADGSVPDLIQDLKLGEAAMTGTADLSGHITGRLAAGLPPIAGLDGPVDVRLHDGQIHRRLNLMLAIAAASDTLNPFRSRDTIPYDEIDGKVRFDHGTLRTESLSLTGSAVRMVATGSVDVLHPPHELQVVVGLFFFKTLDTVISYVPLVNRLILGNDDNLVAAYFALTGPWASPMARVIPVKSILSPASIVTEGLPGFVRSGFSTLQRLLGVQGSETPPEPSPPPPAGPSPPPATQGKRP